MSRALNYVPRVAIFLAGVAAGAISNTRRNRSEDNSVAGQELKKALAEKVLVVDFLRGALHKVEARRRQSESAGGAESTTRSRK